MMMMMVMLLLSFVRRMVRRLARLLGGYGNGRRSREDRISQLPDEIIHRILYLASSPKAAARTSVLSTRWLHIWHAYPVLEFSFREVDCGFNIASQFRSFAAAASRRLSLLPPDFALDAFRISVPTFQVEKNKDLDRLLLLLNTSVRFSPVEFVFEVFDGRNDPTYSLSFSNWSRTKLIKVSGCALSPAAASICDDADAVLGSLEVLRLVRVNLAQDLLHSFLAKAPRLQSLSLRLIYGMYRLEVSSPHLRSLHLDWLFREPIPGKLAWFPPRGYPMAGLRVSSPKLERLTMGSFKCFPVEDLEIDAPNLATLSWIVSGEDPLTNVNVVNLASNCQFTVRVASPGDATRWLGQSLPAKCSRFHRLNLVFESSEKKVGVQLPRKSSKRDEDPPTWGVTT